MAGFAAVVATPAMAQAPAAASDRPLMTPSREASVLYRMTKTGAAPVEVRVTTRAGGSPMRLDLPDGGYMLVDEPAHRVEMVVPNEAMVMELPYEDGPQAQFRLDERMRFTRRGADTVATLRCTTWDVLLVRARRAVCISDDGVLLRLSGQDEAGRRTLIEALSVSFAPAPASDFEAPADFDHMAAAPDSTAPSATVPR